MELFGIGITLLSIVLTYLAWSNGRWMKQAHRDSMEHLTHIEKGQQEARREMAETLKHLVDLQHEGRREMAEAIRHLGDLIVSEGEKTRQTLKA